MVSYQHGGDIYRNQISLDFSVNVNPLGIPETVKMAFLDSVTELSNYPDGEAAELTGNLAIYHDLPEEWILCGNGCADLIFQLAAARKPKRAVVAVPTFAEYEAALSWVGCEVLHFYLPPEAGFRLSVKTLADFLAEQSQQCAIDMLFLCNPNNPTGLAVCSEDLMQLLAVCDTWGITLVVDECFGEFMEAYGLYSMIDVLRDGGKVIILKAFTKTYALAGIRLGYLLCPDEALLAAMKAGRQPWSVSIPAQRMGVAALAAEGFLAQTRAVLLTERSYLKEALEENRFFVYPSQANYLFFKNPWESIIPLGDYCRERKILIRHCENYPGLTAGYYRICIKTRAENQQLLALLGAYRSVCSG